MIGLTLGLNFSTKQTFFLFIYFLRIKLEVRSGTNHLFPPTAFIGLFFLFWVYKAVTDKLVHLKSSVCEEN